MEKEQKALLYKTKLHGMEIKALFYEAPAFMAALLVAAALAHFNVRILIQYDLLMQKWPPIVSLAIMIALGLGAILWAASYYPQELEIHEDRLALRMLLGRREVLFSAIEDVIALEDEATKKALLNPLVISMTAAFSEAVLLKKSGLDWGLSPLDREEFLEKLGQAMARPLGKDSEQEQSDEASPQD